MKSCSLAALVLCFCGCSSLGTVFQDTAEETLTKEFAVKPDSKVVVDTFNGQIEVKVGAANHVEASLVKVGVGANKADAEADLKNIEVTMSYEENVVRVAARMAKGMKQWNRAAHVKLSVPARTILDLKTSNGRITAQGPVGNIHAQTSNGAVTVRQAAGDLTLHTSNGAVIVEGGTGQMDLESSNGDIDVQSSNGVVKAGTSNGSIRYSGKLAAGESSMHTSNGSIDVRLPADAVFRLDAQTSLGSVTTDLPLLFSSDSGKSHVRGRLGEDPKVDLKLESSIGSITVNRAE
jgi:DUF4097 and DUF4098 domain-containing protein YvlB